MSGTIDYGIDLGTTNSAIARFDGAEMRIFKNRDQMDVTPSVVQIDRSGRIIVGRRAYNSLMADPDNVAAEFKRWMGQSDRKSFAATGKEYSAEELSAEVLKALLDDVARQSGARPPAAVITVPAAFGQLQCEATSRAARLAGLSEVLLVQEPVAAAIAYGMKPESHEKRFLVYDLGGGTFDVAVVSTRDGQLSVLDHCGNNMLGGKDIDRLIVRKLLLPQLNEIFNLGAGEGSSADARRLLQTLQRKGEEAKIDLSFSEQAIISIFDVGADNDGREIEAELTITRAELNRIVEPLVEETIALCRQAIEGARLSPLDIASVVLVGGPTQMPVVREALTAAFNAPLDFSIDPMTVVARGAAIYASTCPRRVEESAPAGSSGADEAKSGAVRLRLAYEPVWPDTTCLVAGRVELDGTGDATLELFIEGESGHWTSGWMPVRDGYFEAMVQIPEGRTERFTISLRGPSGEKIAVTPDSFAIRHGLALSEPPLPHSIGAEIAHPNGESELDVIFPRSTPLPAEKVVTYKANRTLKPSVLDESIAIKLWEGESPDPETNNFVGALQIRSEEIRRPIREGADIELTISIDASRRMEVHAFVPSIGQHFQEKVYVAQENDPNLLARMEGLDDEILECREKLRDLDNLARTSGNHEAAGKLRELNGQVDDLWLAFDEFRSGGAADPDDARKLYQRLIYIRGRLSVIRKKLSASTPFERAMAKLREERSDALMAAAEYGSAFDKKEVDQLCSEAEEHIKREDADAIERMAKEFRRVCIRILIARDEFWIDWFHHLSGPYRTFLDRAEADRHLERGRRALERGDQQVLRDAVRSLWKLMPNTEEYEEEKRGMDAGIRRSMRQG